jgi:type II secretory pathway pseudopilin PulG
MLLWWVALSGVMLMALAERWSHTAQRQREAELAFRGDQIQRAIEAYAQVPVGEGSTRLPRRLEDLLEDRRSGQVERHLRRLWPDPITGQPWVLVRQGGSDTTEGGIAGVHSPSTRAPLRKDVGDTYAEWQFVASVGEGPTRGASAAKPPNANGQTDVNNFTVVNKPSP